MNIPDTWTFIDGSWGDLRAFADHALLGSIAAGCMGLFARDRDMPADPARLLEDWYNRGEWRLLALTMTAKGAAAVGPHGRLFHAPPGFSAWFRAPGGAWDKLEAEVPAEPAQGLPARYVAVRFFPPDVPPHVVCFDRHEPSHIAAWDENARWYPSQVIACGGDHDAIKSLETPL